MRRHLVPITLAAALPAVALPAPAAEAAGRLVVRGAGYGHGVGMSQYGAYGYASRAGWSYDRILRHYYSGTAIDRIDPGRRVRVLLREGGTHSVSHADRAGARRLDPARSVRVASRAGRVVVGDRAHGASVLLTGPDDFVELGGKGFRGALRLTAVPGGVQVVEEVGVDDYVRGVIPLEMPASWHPEALKAQAVTARTYALTEGRTYLYTDTRSQVYGGMTAEDRRSSAAVRATRGRVVTHGGLPVVTYFFSTSGGRTENVEHSFVGASPQPWLKSVPDRFDSISPVHRWRESFSTAAAGRRLRAYFSGRFRGIRILRRGISPRVVQARVVGSRGSRLISGPSLRARLDLRDTWVDFFSVTGRARRVRTGARSSGAAILRRTHPPAEMAGEVVGLPPRTRVVVQRRTGDGWRRVDSFRLAPSGRYAWRTYTRGAYRLAADGFTGPAVRLVSAGPSAG